MSVQRLHVAVLVACAALCGVVLLRERPASSPGDRAPFGPLDAIPSGVELLATVDVEALRRTEIGAAIAREGRIVPGLGSLREICGYDPTAGIRELAATVALPEGGGLDQADVGLAASGDLPLGPVVDCAERVIHRRGGAPVRTQIGSFTVVRDRQRAAVEVAVRPDLVLVGSGALLREMIDTADGQVAPVRSDQVHAVLRRSLGPGLLVATLTLPRGWLSAAIEPELARRSPLAAVTTAALRVEAAPGVEATLVLGCAAAEVCGPVHELLQRSAGDLQDLLQHELGVTLESAEVRAAERAAVISLRLSPEQAARALSRLLERGQLP